VVAVRAAEAWVVAVAASAAVERTRPSRQQTAASGHRMSKHCPCTRQQRSPR
jgi:hypothetical protein